MTALWSHSGVPTNAVLYANRAAVLLAQKVYMYAAYDCRKAVELDPKYAKAGRLGTASHALAAWTECLRAWKMALDCLPKENLTPAQENMKAQFTQGLANARVARKKIETSAVAVSDLEKMPWVVASELRNRKMASGKPASQFPSNNSQSSRVTTT
ncbi:hypothetical protein D9611_009863 [Ephemerocybe angulata]|uniref:Uncharacterized protein n=1 Tax=Ephemerocybe angulata TaxID=980116 RepID=A0A8H5FJZ8_9AGAR|nr:hypothetical protein D9611_009863 [Tulosesus angulatus]